MTLIVGLTGPDWAVLGGDRLLTSDDGSAEGQIVKVRRTKGLLLGASGDLWCVNAIHEIPFSRYSRAQWKRLHKEKPPGALEGEFVVLWRGGGYVVGLENGGSAAVSGEVVSGSGIEIARGVLWATRRWKSPHRRIQEALEAAAYHRTDVGGPFDLVEL